eukprot:g80395.t1
MSLVYPLFSAPYRGNCLERSSSSLPILPDYHPLTLAAINSISPHAARRSASASPLPLMNPDSKNGAIDYSTMITIGVDDPSINPVSKNDWPLNNPNTPRRRWATPGLLTGQLFRKPELGQEEPGLEEMAQKPEEPVEMPPSPDLSREASVFMDGFRVRLRSLKRRRHFWSKYVSRLRRVGMPLYFSIHLAYFCFWAIVGSVVCYLIEGGKLRYIDSLYMCTSALCLSCFAPVDMSLLKTATWCMQILLMQLGGMVFTSMPVLLLRRRLLMNAHDDIQAEMDVAVQDPDVHNYFCSLGIGPEQRRELRKMADIEGLAVGLLLKYVLMYQVVIEVLVAGWIGAYLNTGGRDSLLVTTDGKFINPWFFGFYVSVAAFCNAGGTPLPDSLMRFSNHPMVLIPLTVEIFLGTTAFPFVLRALVSGSAKLSDHLNPNMSVVINFLLIKSRVVYPYLFSASYTSVLKMVWSAIYMSECCIFWFSEAGRWGADKALTNVNSVGQFIMAGIFNSASSRSAGFNAVDIGALTPGHLVYLILCMYTVTYPILFVIRSSSTSRKTKETRKILQSYVQQAEKVGAVEGISGVVGQMFSLMPAESYNEGQAQVRALTANGRVDPALIGPDFEKERKRQREISESSHTGPGTPQPLRPVHSYAEGPMAEAEEMARDRPPCPPPPPPPLFETTTTN